MRKIILTALLLACMFTVNGQEAQNIADLDFLYKSIQELPSYKDQLKGDKNYQQLYETLRKDLKTGDDFEIYQKLLQLIIPIRDNHLGFYRTLDSNFRFVPAKPKVNLGSLVKKYAGYPIDSLEGVYDMGNEKYILYPVKKDTYHLVGLADEKLVAILYKNGYGNYDAIKFFNPPYSYTLIRNTKLLNGFLTGLYYNKGAIKALYNSIDRKKTYEYKVLDDQIGYLSLGTFNSTDQAIKLATDFFDGVKQNITVQTLIVDLRNNSGGGFKNSRQFLTFLNNFNGKIYILQNGYTVSNAEQFIINLKGKENVTTLGETTKGMITYGNNYGKSIVLPSKRFTLYPTDMVGLKKYLAFESIGVKPDVTLDPFTEDWIQQTLKYIKAN